MLTIEYRDLFNAMKGQRVVLAHGVNAQAVMGAGVAALVKKYYNYAYQDYLMQKHRLHLGQTIFSTSETSPVVIASCVTQEFYGRENKVYVDYDSVVICMQAVAKYSKENNIPVALPLIGAGLARGDKRRLIAIFSAAFHEIDATLYLQEE